MRCLKLLFPLFLFFAFLNSGYSFSGVETDLAWMKWLAAILGLVYFFISFASTATGLAFMTISMLFSPELSVGALGHRSITIRIEDILIPILVIAWLARAATRKQLTFVKSPVNIPIFALLITSVAATTQGYFWGWVKPVEAFFYFGKTVEYFLIFFLVLNYVRTERQIQLFLFFALLTIALMGIYSIMQVPTAAMFTVNRVSSPFEDQSQPATAGGYLAFSFLILLSLFLYERDFLKKWLFAGLAIMTIVSLLYTFSRTAYAALLGGIVILAVLSNLKWLRLTVILMILLSPVILPQTVKERIAWTWEDSHNPGRVFGVDFSFQERIIAFDRSLAAVRRNPVFGLGISSWNYVDNQYARTLHEVGLLGFGLWMWIFLRLFKMGRWLHRYLPDGSLKGLALGYSAGIIAILMHGFGSCTFYIIRIMEPFWFISGLVIALYLIKVRECSVAQESSLV